MNYIWDNLVNKQRIAYIQTYNNWYILHIYSYILCYLRRWNTAREYSLAGRISVSLENVIGSDRGNNLNGIG